MGKYNLKNMLELEEPIMAVEEDATMKFQQKGEYLIAMINGEMSFAVDIETAFLILRERLDELSEN